MLPKAVDFSLVVSFTVLWVAARHDGVLHALHHHIDTLCAQASACCGVMLRAGGLQRPLKSRRAITLHADALDGEARCLIRRNLFPVGLVRRRQAHVRVVLLLLAQRALSLLLTKQFLRGRVLPLRHGRYRGEPKTGKHLPDECRPWLLLSLNHKTPFHRRHGHAATQSRSTQVFAQRKERRPAPGCLRTATPRPRTATTGHLDSNEP